MLKFTFFLVFSYIRYIFVSTLKLTDMLNIKNLLNRPETRVHFTGNSFVLESFENYAEYDTKHVLTAESSHIFLTEWKIVLTYNSDVEELTEEQKDQVEKYVLNAYKEEFGHEYNH